MIDDRTMWDTDSVHDLLQRVSSAYRWMHVEKLEEVDGAASYTMAQGEN
jgi:hypothetical protein